MFTRLIVTRICDLQRFYYLKCSGRSIIKITKLKIGNKSLFSGAQLYLLHIFFLNCSTRSNIQKKINPTRKIIRVNSLWIRPAEKKKVNPTRWRTLPWIRGLHRPDFSGLGRSGPHSCNFRPALPEVKIKISARTRTGRKKRN